VAWVFYLQRRDEDRHALFFDRIAADVLGLPGDVESQWTVQRKRHKLSAQRHEVSVPVDIQSPAPTCAATAASRTPDHDHNQ
jgi:hypothetical protein